MKWRSTLFLFIVALGLAAYIEFVDRREESTAQQRERRTRAFLIDPDSVEAVTVERDDLILKCSKDHGIWMMLQPVHDFADPQYIQEFLYRLCEVKKDTVISKSEREAGELPLSQYGLENPQIRLSIVDRVRQRTYLIGRPTVTGKQVYMMDSISEDIVPISTNVLELIPENPSKWRNHELFCNKARYVHRVAMKRREGYVQLQRDNNNVWMMLQPVKARCNSLAVNKLFGGIYDVRIQQFVADRVGDPSIYGLSSDMNTISFIPTESANTFTLLVGNPVKNEPGLVYAMWDKDEAIYAVTNTVAQLLDVPTESMRSRRLLSIPPNLINSIGIKSGTTSFELELTDDLWTMKSPISQPVDQRLMHELISAWAKADILHFVADGVSNAASYGVESDGSSIQFLCKMGHVAETNTAQQVKSLAEQTFSFSRNPPENHRIAVLDMPANSVVEVDSSLLQGLVSDPLYYRDPQLFDYTMSNIVKIAITEGDKEVVIELDGESGAMLDPQMTGGIIQSNQVRYLLEVLPRLRVVKYIANFSDSLWMYGLDDPTAKITMSLTGDSAIGKTLLIGAQTNDQKNYYAMIRGQDIVFTLSTETVESLLQPLLMVPSAPVPENTATTVVTNSVE